MGESFQASLSFDLSEEEAELYNRYGISAIELAKEGELPSAIKLLDRVLGTNQNVEFALILKANYLFNLIDFNPGAVDVEELNNLMQSNSPESVDAAIYKMSKTKKPILEIIESFDQCVDLLERASQINPENKNTLEFIEFLKENRAEPESLLKVIDECIQTAESKKSGPHDGDEGKPFTLKDEDRVLYQRYGIIAEELANDGELMPAIKLLDKALVENPNAEFALVMKAFYSCAYYAEEGRKLLEDASMICNILSSPDGITQHEQNQYKKQFYELAERIGNNRDPLQECVNLIDKAIKMNPSNERAKDFKKDIQSMLNQLSDF